MKGQYGYVGPAIFVMETLPEMARPVIYARSREPVSPAEVWIEIHKTWVRLNGEWISGRDGDEYFGFRPHWLNRWKIRRAARHWQRAARTPQMGETNDD
jgi:hypothetical protein